MKYFIKRNEERIHKQDAWKKSAYAFVPYQTNFGELCGFADDVVEAGKGFGMHPHQNMEISTIVISGAQIHKDDTGSEGMIEENSVQTMSAGTGIMHSEYNASETEPFYSFQIWVYPKTQHVLPRYEKFSYQPLDKLNTVLLTLSPDGRNGTAVINQDAFFSVSKLEAGEIVEYTMNLEGNGVYIHCAEGQLEIENQLFNKGDAAGFIETNKVSIKGIADAEIIFVEVPMGRGIRF